MKLKKHIKLIIELESSIYQDIKKNEIGRNIGF
jgi:hypothetical protein